MLHVDDGQLHAYLDGEDTAKAADLERHVANCTECRTRLEDARRLRDRAQAILRSGDPAPLHAPHFEEVVAQAEPTETHRPVRRFRPGPAVVWAASLALALGVGWLARDSWQTSEQQVAIEAESPAVADAPPPLALSEPASPPEPEGETLEAESAEAAKTSRAESPPPPPQQVAETSVDIDVPEIAAVEPELMETARPLAAPAPAAAGEARERNSVAGAVAAGQVTDESGTPLAGAQVIIPELGAGTLTAADGTYSLTVPESRIPADRELEIRVALIGMQSEAEPVVLKTGQTVTRNFQLEQTALTLDEVVVTGEGAEESESAGARSDSPTSSIESQSFADAAVRWSPVTREDAERMLGSRLLRVEGLPVIGLAVGTENEMLVIRTLQRLSGGEVLELVQRRVPAGERRAGRAEAELPRRPAAPVLEETTFEAADAASVEVTIGSALIAARAPISPDSLRVLLSRLR